MMDNPNTTSSVNLRRHQTGPPTSSGRTRTLHSLAAARSTSSHRLLQKKSNPYVGTFRHAPPTSPTDEGTPMNQHHRQHQQQRTPPALLTERYNHRLKQSPYVGWLRLAPCNTMKIGRRTFLEQELMFLLLGIPKSYSSFKKINGILKLSDLLSGHLKGGCEDSGYLQRHLSTRNPQGSSAFSSPLLNLTRLLLWVILPFTEDGGGDSQQPSEWSSQPSKQCDSESVSISQEGDDHEEEEDSLDDDDSMTSLPERSIVVGGRSPRAQPIDLSISSQAEAYYTHVLSKELAFPPADNDESSRLDYDITQMDIVRMNRNASLHLDVESIVKLPTITYQAPATTTTKTALSSNKDKKQDPGKTHVDENDEAKRSDESWMLVQSGLEVTGYDEEANGLKDKAHQEIQVPEQDVCVICLEPFCHGDRLRVLPCDHSFHVGCIDRWLSGSHSFDDCITSGCPTCKKRPGDNNTNNAYRDDDDDDDENAGFRRRGSMEHHQEWTVDPDGSVPSWAFANLGDALARNSRHF